MIESYTPYLIGLAVCFLLGSIPFAVISTLGSGIDIRKVGSGNPGFNNVLRVSKARAVLTLIGDMGKGFLAVWLMIHLWPFPASIAPNVPLKWLLGFAVVAGHCYSPFLKFNGGKGIATSGGVMLVLYPAWAALALLYFVVVRVTLAKLKWQEAGATTSMSAWALFSVLMFFFVGHTDALFAALMTLFLAWRHKKNFQNLLAAQNDR